MLQKLDPYQEPAASSLTPQSSLGGCAYILAIIGWVIWAAFAIAQYVNTPNVTTVTYKSSLEFDDNTLLFQLSTFGIAIGPLMSSSLSSNPLKQDTKCSQAVWGEAGHTGSTPVFIGVTKPVASTHCSNSSNTADGICVQATVCPGSTGAAVCGVACSLRGNEIRLPTGTVIPYAMTVGDPLDLVIQHDAMFSVAAAGFPNTYTTGFWDDALPDEEATPSTYNSYIHSACPLGGRPALVVLTVIKIAMSHITNLGVESVEVEDVSIETQWLTVPVDTNGQAGTFDECTQRTNAASGCSIYNATEGFMWRCGGTNITANGSIRNITPYSGLGLIVLQAADQTTESITTKGQDGPLAMLGSIAGMWGTLLGFGGLGYKYAAKIKEKKDARKTSVRNMDTDADEEGGTALAVDNDVEAAQKKKNAGVGSSRRSNPEALYSPTEHHQLQGPEAADDLDN